MVALAYEPEPVYPLLVRAAEVLERYGWCQGVYGRYNTGPFCVFSAMLQAQIDLDASDEEFGLAERALKRAIGPSWDKGNSYLRIERWNDDAERTFDQVVTLLRQVGMWGQ
jgi:hypothetical protein